MRSDVQLVNGGPILVWHEHCQLKIWDVEGEKLLLTADGVLGLKDLKISEDGSRVFSLGVRSIQAQSIHTGEIVKTAGIKFMEYRTGSLAVEASRVWVHYPNSEDQAWDFETTGSLPVQLPNLPSYRLHPNGIVLWDIGLSSIKEKATGKVVFQLSKKYRKPSDVQWNNQYLVACFITGEVLVLDLSHMLL